MRMFEMKEGRGFGGEFEGLAHGRWRKAVGMRMI